MQLHTEQSAVCHTVLAQKSSWLDEEVLEVCTPIRERVNKRGRPLQPHTCELHVQLDIRLLCASFRCKHGDALWRCSPEGLYTATVLTFPWTPPPFAADSWRPLLLVRYLFCKIICCNLLKSEVNLIFLNINLECADHFFINWLAFECGMLHYFEFHGLKSAMNGKSSPSACIK